MELGLSVMGVDLSWLASRFDDLSKRYPRLSLITAMRPEELESVEYCQDDLGDGDWSHPSPAISDRFEPQYFTNLTETEIAFPKRGKPITAGAPPGACPILISTGNFVSFPEWNFYGWDKGPWSLGIWSMWLHRDLGNELAIHSDISKKSKLDHIACLEEFAQILAIASTFVREHHNELGLPEWMKHGSSTNPSGMHNQFQGCCAWLLYLAFTSHFKEHSSSPKDRKKKPINLRIIKDIGLASVLVLRELEKDRDAETAQFSETVDPQKEIRAEAFAAVVAGGFASTIQAAVSLSSVDRITKVMRSMLEKNNEYYSWRIGDWVSHFRVARKTVIASPAWEEIKAWRAANRQAIANKVREGKSRSSRLKRNPTPTD